MRVKEETRYVRKEDMRRLLRLEKIVGLAVVKRRIFLLLLSQALFRPLGGLAL
jgi:hypothetical protein